MLDELLLRLPILGSKLIDYDDFFEMIIRFAINFSVVFMLVRVIYFPIHKRKDYLVTFFLPAIAMRLPRLVRALVLVFCPRAGNRLL